MIVEREEEIEKFITQEYWDLESAKPRKYYKLSEYGNTIYKKLCLHWTEMAEKIDRLINEEDVN